MGFSSQEYWNGLPFPSPGDLPNPGIKLRSPALEEDTHAHLFCDPMNYSLPGSSAHGISQASIREWVVISFSKGSFQPSDRDSVSYIDRQILYHWATWGAPSLLILFTFISVGQRWLNYYTERSMPLKEEFMTYISWDKGACHACRTRGEALTSSDEEQKQKWGES